MLYFLLLNIQIIVVLVRVSRLSSSDFLKNDQSMFHFLNHSTNVKKDGCKIPTFIVK